MVRRRIAIVCVLVVLGVAGYGVYRYYTAPLVTPLSSQDFSRYVRTLDKYSFSRLRKQEPEYGPIVLGRIVERFPTFTSFMFSFQTHGKTVTGLLNLPRSGGKHPVIMMMRGYVDKEIYYSGLGTKRAGEVFAKEGYITIAPDFLGYGGSDPESEDIFEARFEKPQTILDLLAALETLKQADAERIGLWGHSNGGQITLSILEITQKPYPTVLWAPVTQAFPDSILEYVDELPDSGEYIRSTLVKFDAHYQTQDYSIASHWNDIAAPLQFHQGAADEEVGMKQTQEVVGELKDLGKTVSLFTYPGENHNFTKGSFDLVIQRSLDFFSKALYNFGSRLYVRTRE